MSHFDESDPALAALRQSAVEVEDQDPRFERRVVRRATVRRESDSWRFWSPLMLGATVGLLAMLAALQLLKPPTGPIQVQPTGEARNAAPDFPRLDP